jgi:hypothetical protein
MKCHFMIVPDFLVVLVSVFKNLFDFPGHLFYLFFTTRDRHR